MNATRLRFRVVVRRVVIVSVVLLLSACAPGKLGDNEKEQIAREYIQRLVEGDIDALAAELEPSLRTGTEVEALKKLREFIPAEEPTVTNLIGMRTFNAIGKWTDYGVTFQFGYDSNWYVLTASWRELPDGSRQVMGLRANPIPEALEVTNAFSFKNAGILHYFFLVCAVGVPLFIVVTLVVCIRTRIRRAKWIWIVFILFGVGQVSINWTTGQMGVKAMSILLLGAGVSKASLYSPVIITFAIPVGAILFWFLRKQLIGPHVTANQPPGPNPVSGGPPTLSS